MEVSFVVPAHNEMASLVALLREIRVTSARHDLRSEIVIVDDGSTDGSGEWLDAQVALADDLVVLHLDSNRGQSAAMAAGLAYARGEILVTLDADGQNDPADAPRLLAALESADLACGVRTKRRDSWSKRVGSRFANAFRRLVLGRHDDFRDVGCTLKAWRRAVVPGVPKFAGFHRFIPILARAAGFRVVEVPVSHRARTAGRTHYGNFGRAIHGFVDLCGVAWLCRRRIEVVQPAREPACRE